MPRQRKWQEVMIYAYLIDKPVFNKRNWRITFNTFNPRYPRGAKKDPHFFDPQ